MVSRSLVENRHIVVKRCKHGVFMYNRNDSFVGRSLDLYGEWCDFELQLLGQFIRPGDTVIDAGANIGTHTVAFANMVGPGGVVHAFEPQRRSFLMLAGNVALNALDNVFCHQKALGDSVGEVLLPQMPSAEHFFNYSAMSIVRHAPGGETVPLVTLDSLNLSTCRVIKIDTEGMEEQVIDGACELIARCRPILYVENNGPNSERMNAILDELGYGAWWSTHPYYNPRNFFSNTENVWPKTVPSTNMICAPKEANISLPRLEPFLGADDHWQACALRVGSLISERR
jgi:FkbM family methyltransferase